MLLHYLKITFRNIAKNKFQYLLTTLGIAAGITIFATLYFMMDIATHYFVDLPNEKNLFAVEIAEETTSELSPSKNDYRSWNSTSLENLTKLKELQMPEIEAMTLYSGYVMQSVFCSPENNKRVVFGVSLRYVDANYFPVIGVNFSHGNIDGWGNRRLAVITETLAKKLFGSASNALWQNIELRNANNELRGLFTVAGIIKPIYAFSYRADIFLENEINEHTESYSALAKLSPEASFQQTNISIKAVSKTFNIPPRSKSKQADNDKMFFRLAELKEYKTNISPFVHAIVLLLASTVLIIALFNFFNLLVSSVQVRIRQFTLRKIVGAKHWTLLLIFFCEIIPVMLGATLLSYVFIEMLMAWYNSSIIAQGMLGVENFIHLIYGYPLRVALYTLLTCFVVIVLLTYRVEKIVLVQGIRGKLLKSNRGFARKGLIFFQLLFTLFLFSVSAELFRLGANAVPNIYQTLSKEQAKAVFIMNFRGKLGMEQKTDEISARMKRIAGVESIAISDIFYDRLTTGTTLSNGKQIYLTKKILFDGYAEFMEMREPLPVATLAPDEVIVNETLAKVLAENGETDMSLYGEKYKIVGVVSQIPYTDNNESCALFSPKTINPSYAVKCNPEQAKVVKTEIMKIIREYLPETIPFSLQNFYNIVQNENMMMHSIVGALAIATFMSLILTLFGIYATVSADTKRSKKEIAIRKINGATHRNILWKYLKQYAIMLVIILAPLLPLYLFTMKIMTRKLANIGIVFITWLTLTLFVLFTIYNLIKKAASENPAKVLKSE